jgi:hypothetical protein
MANAKADLILVLGGAAVCNIPAAVRGDPHYEKNGKECLPFAKLGY